MGRRSLDHSDGRKNWEAENHPKSNYNKLSKINLRWHEFLYIKKKKQCNHTCKRSPPKCNEVWVKAQNRNLANWQSQTKNQNANKANQHPLGFFIHSQPLSIEIIVLAK